MRSPCSQLDTSPKTPMASPPLALISLVVASEALAIAERTHDKPRACRASRVAREGLQRYGASGMLKV
jgi:hypothetical protein